MFERLGAQPQHPLILSADNDTQQSHKYLQHLVWGGLDARRHVCRTEGNLLHFSKVVLGVTIQNKLPNWDPRKLLLGPYLHISEKRGRRMEKRGEVGREEESKGGKSECAS